MTDSVQIFPPGFRVTDDETGAPLSGAKLKFYDVGTTTPKTVYSNSGLSSSLGSTVYTDSLGAPVASSGSNTEVMVYTGTAAYKLVITDSDDNTIMSLDNIKGAIDTSTFLTTGSTSTLTQSVISKTADYTIVAADRSKLVEVNATGGTFTLTLTAAATLGDGWSCKIRNSGSANTVNLSASQNIRFEGSTFTSRDLAVGEGFEIICNATDFRMIGQDAGVATATALPHPQGYLTPTSATPVIAADVTSATVIYYTPYAGNFVPIYDGSIMVQKTFAELTLTLSASHVLSSIYDVFIFLNPSGGAVTVGTGPAWSTITAGSCARGSGAGTTGLSRVGGLLTNANAMTARNSATTYSLSANQATYVGSLFIDGVAGQVTCHRSWGQSRKWGIWNAFHRKPIILKAGDSTASWAYNTNTWRAANGSSANSLTVFQGLAEEMYILRNTQRVTVAVPGGGSKTQASYVGIGWNSTSALSGRQGAASITNPSADDNDMTISAEFIQVPSLGINVVTALEIAPNTQGTPAQFGGEDDFVLSALWTG
jgi:hypothetical protein